MNFQCSQITNSFLLVCFVFACSRATRTTARRGHSGGAGRSAQLLAEVEIKRRNELAPPMVSKVMPVLELLLKAEDAKPTFAHVST